MQLPIEKPIQNWTRFPNCILDNIDQFTTAEFKVLSFMIRKNIGYDKPNKQFSLQYIANRIKMGKPTVHKAIKGLLDKGSIAVIGNENLSNCYDIYWVEPSVKKLNRLKNDTDTGKEIEPIPVKKFNPVKENKVQDNKVKENNTIVIPDQLKAIKGFEDTWKDWIQYKKDIKNKVTPLSAKRQFTMLMKQSDPVAVIDQSIENGWKGLFPLKAQTFSQKPRQYDDQIKASGVPDNLFNEVYNMLRCGELLPNQIKSSVLSALKQKGLL